MDAISQVRWAVMLLAGVCLSQAGCSVLSSHNPLLALDHARLDKGLCGVWRCEPKPGEFVYLHVGAAGKDFPGGVMRAIIVGEEDNIPEARQYLFWPATIDDATYINVVMLPEGETTVKWTPDRIKNYLIFKCRIEKDTLALFTVANRTVWDEAVKLKQVRADTNNNIDLTDSTDELRRFFAASKGKLFDEKDSSARVFHRVK